MTQETTIAERLRAEDHSTHYGIPLLIEPADELDRLAVEIRQIADTAERAGLRTLARTLRKVLANG